MQKITDGRFDYPIISPEAMRNALREIIASDGYKTEFNTLCNRERLHPVSGKGKSEESEEGEKQGLAVKFMEYPNPEKYTDDFLFGYLMAVKKKELDKLRKEKGANYPMKRDSVLRMNMAKALEAYRFNAVFTQSPEIKDSPWKPGGGDGKSSSALLHRETAHTAFQYPFALCGEDCKPKPVWVRALLKAIGELADVAGNQARSYYEMAPASIIIRLTPRLVAGYETYGFRITRDPMDAQSHTHLFPEVIDGILHDVPELDPDGKPVMEGEETKKQPKMKPAPDYPSKEFFIGGKIVKDMPQKQAKKLTERGVTLDRDPQRLLETVADKFLGGK